MDELDAPFNDDDITDTQDKDSDITKYTVPETTNDLNNEDLETQSVEEMEKITKEASNKIIKYMKEQRKQNLPSIFIFIYILGIEKEKEWSSRDVMNKVFEYMQYEKSKQNQSPPPSPPFHYTSPTYSPTSTPPRSPPKKVSENNEIQQDVAIIMATLDCIKMQFDKINEKMNTLEKEKEEEKDLEITDEEECNNQENVMKKFNNIIHQLFHNLHMGKLSISENKYWYEISAMIKKESDN